MIRCGPIGSEDATQQLMHLTKTLGASITTKQELDTAYNDMLDIIKKVTDIQIEDTDIGVHQHDSNNTISSFPNLETRSKVTRKKPIGEMQRSAAKKKKTGRQLHM